MRLTDDQRILAGARDEHYTAAAKRDKLINAKTRQMRKEFTKHFPASPFESAFSWTGIFGTTKDGLPNIGSYHKLPNCLFALHVWRETVSYSARLRLA